MSGTARWRPRIRTVLLLVTLLILLLPLGGIAALRLYENHLLWRTEAELIAQGAVVREVFRLEHARESGRVTIAQPDENEIPEPAPLLPRLDISRERVLPAAPDARPAAGEADPHAVAAGRLLAPVLHESGRVTLAGIRVVDRRGVVVATSRSELGLSLGHREEVLRALAGEPVSLLRRRVSDEPSPPLRSISRGERHRVFVALPIEDRGEVIGAVVLSRTPLDIAKALYLNRRPLLVGAAVLLLVVAVVAILTSLTISRPVRALTRQAEQVTRGTRGAVAPLAEPGTHEVARLSEALSTMSETLERRADYIRSFAGHVSHEFKTPLTTIRGTVELLREHLDGMTPYERARFLGHVDEAAERLQRLVERLLEQARADVATPGNERSDVPSVLRRVAERFREENLDVTVDADDAAGSARVAEEILHDVVSNLLDNARQHGGDDVRVAVRARRAPGAGWEIEVRDDGAGVSAANAGRIFTPFFTTARERGGSGLGLSIARSLLEAHGGTIELAGTGPGAAFVLRIPAG